MLLKSLYQKYPTSKIIGIETRSFCVEDMVKQGFDCRHITEEFFSTDERFDVIYGAAVLHHISKPYEYIKHLYSLLKPEGIIVFINEAYRYDIVNLLGCTITNTWRYEKHLFKLSKRKIQHTLQTLTQNYCVEYTTPVFISGLGVISTIYNKLKINRIPGINGLSFMLQAPAIQ